MLIKFYKKSWSIIILQLRANCCPFTKMLVFPKDCNFSWLNLSLMRDSQLATIGNGVMLCLANQPNVGPPQKKCWTQGSQNVGSLQTKSWRKLSAGYANWVWKLKIISAYSSRPILTTVKFLPSSAQSSSAEMVFIIKFRPPTHPTTHTRWK